ncbi:MAG TPA: squalene synthase HpnC [Streptosporangiaceae bacterium]|nr:squalene synthase HpnC [Streptosporangiaceae bacterium]
MTRNGTGAGSGLRTGPQPAAAATDAADEANLLAGQAAGENFPVALRLLPARHREHLMAVYGFARTVDDIGDEAPPTQRPHLLDELEADLRRLYASYGPTGTGSGGASGSGGDDEEPRSRVVRSLAATVTDCAIPMQPFLDLILANRQDQVVSRYATFTDLLGYCRLSANPVGRIVLYVFDSFTPGRAELSDSVCTALQLAEHWQDVAEDLRAGRIYVPAADMETYGCTQQDLAQASAPPSVRALMAFETGRARTMLDAGAPLIGMLRGAGRVAVAGYVAGGRAALAAIAAADHDVLRATPRPRRRRLAGELILAYARGR